MNKVFFKLKKKEKEIIKKKIKNILLKEKTIGFAYIFGSFVNEREFSDIDIGIYILPDKYNPEREIDITLDIGTKIERKIKIPVDLIIINSANPHLRFKIISGELLFTRDKNLHDFTIDYYLREYWDEKVFFERIL